MCVLSLSAALGGVFAAASASIASAAGAAGAAAVASTAATTAFTTAGTILTTGAGILSEVVATGALVGGIVGTVGAVQQAEQQKAMADFQAEQDAENARLARKEAEAIEVMGNQEKLQLRQKMLAQKSSGRVGFASGGVVLGSGTTLDYEADIADAYDSEARNLDYDIKSRKWQKQVQAANATDQSAMYRAQARAAERSKTTSLFSGIFNTFSDTAQASMKASEFRRKAGGLA
jgi:hypothetical protein